MLAIDDCSASSVDVLLAKEWERYIRTLLPIRNPNAYTSGRFYYVGETTRGLPTYPSLEVWYIGKLIFKLEHIAVRTCAVEGYKEIIDKVATWPEFEQWRWSRMDNPYDLK